jgi:hypothetical protein
MEQDYMPSFSVPEMLRVPLERLSLQVKVTKEDEDVKVRLRMRSLVIVADQVAGVPTESH